MRDVLFRGKSGGTWVYGSYIKTAVGLHYIIPQNVISDDLPKYVVDKETVGQYIGIEDPMDRMVFDGDIAKSGDDEIRVICYDTNQAKYKAVPLYAYLNNAGQGGWTGYELRNDLRHEIIGNIHDDPELLEVAE
ncbi:YopX family protein [Sporosarcina soli]|uniref:YopX family protein n=1 Tax=Sporosarcina soli TaxID=334736 RepID=A0ABW0TFB6_9BACL